jgi:hypothetical protein
MALIGGRDRKKGLGHSCFSPLTGIHGFDSFGTISGRASAPDIGFSPLTGIHGFDSEFAGAGCALAAGVGFSPLTGIHGFDRHAIGACSCECYGWFQPPYGDSWL